MVGTTALTPAGTYNITVTATDAASVAGSASFTIIVGMNLTHNSIVAGSVASPVTMTAAGTSPPTGVSIHPSTGAITNDGTASTQAGTVLTITATDSAPGTGSAANATGTTTVTITIGS